MKIVALVGRNYVGKSTISSVIVNILKQMDVNACAISFADDVQKELSEMYNLCPATFNYTEEFITDCPIIQRYLDLNGELKVYGYKDKLKFSLNSLNLSDNKLDIIKDLWSDLPISKEEKWLDKEMTLRDLMIYHGTDIRRAEDDLYWVKKMESTIDKLSSSHDLVIIDDARFNTEFSYLKSAGCVFIELCNGVALKRRGEFITKARDKAERLCMDCIEELGTLRTRVLINVPVTYGNVEEVFGLIPISKQYQRN